MRCIQKAALFAGTLVPMVAMAQYPGQVAKKSKDTPDLRAVAVLEWTGDVGKPKTCRIVPVTVFDGEKLQDAGVYLARPEPLALTGEVEYELKDNGKTFGLFDVENAGQEQGTWVGYGKWKPLPVAKPPKPIVPEKIDDVQDDKPVLHRKHAAEAPDPASKNGGSSTSSSSNGAGQPASPDDPDRPTLHKHPNDSGSGTASNAPPADPDRPKLEKKPETEKKPAPSPDAEQPTLQKARPQLAQEIGNVESVDSTDPDRPKLKRGQSSGNGLLIVPSLMGLPPDMQQAVAVSDGKNRPEHLWAFSWASPDDEKKMRAAVEDIARQGLALAPAQPAPAAAPRKAAATTARKSAKTAPPALAPGPLEDEEFRVFELSYGSGATMVLTAHDGAPGGARKFVTIIAQPDLYGNVRVLLKSVTDMAHLDATPRMRLVGAVDALADNRAELLFELRGEGQRQFALYRIYRGAAQKLFVSGGGVYGTLSSD